MKRFMNSLTGSSPARQSKLMDDAHDGTEFCDSERMKLRQSVDSILGLACISGSSRKLVTVLLFELRLRGGTTILVPDCVIVGISMCKCVSWLRCSVELAHSRSEGGCTSICGALAFTLSKSVMRDKSLCMSSSLRRAPGMARPGRPYPPEWRDSMESERVVLLTCERLTGGEYEDDVELEVEELESDRLFLSRALERETSKRGPTKI